MGAAASQTAAPAPAAPLLPSVGELVDALPAGKFVGLHLGRLLLVNVCFAYTLEMNPYIYPGMSTQYGLSASTEALYASSFTSGGVVGAFTVSMQDIFGRTRVIRLSAALATLIMAALAFADTFTLMLTARFFLGWFFITTQNGFSAWYAEHLPTVNRGPWYVALTAGYPIGRFAVILTAANIAESEWHKMLYVGAVLLVVVAFVALMVAESPRHLSVTGREAKGRAYVHDMYAVNGSPLPYDEPTARRLETPKDAAAATEESPLVAGAGHPSDGPPSSEITVQHGLRRWANVCRAPPPSLGYALVLFAGLSCQQQLIQNFSPRVLQMLIYPEMENNPANQDVITLPWSTLLAFNFADLGGIVLSVVLIDRLGRRGFFFVGFTAAALLWGVLGVIRPISGVSTADVESNGPLQAALLTVGALASATRGFAPEAANLWVLETFATEHRATCYAAVQMSYQLTACIVVPLGGMLVDAVDYSPTPLLLAYAAIQLILGVFTYFLPNETANVPLEDISSAAAPTANKEPKLRAAASVDDAEAPAAAAKEDVLR